MFANADNYVLSNPTQNSRSARLTVRTFVLFPRYLFVTEGAIDFTRCPHRNHMLTVLVIAIVRILRQMIVFRGETEHQKRFD